MDEDAKLSPKGVMQGPMDDDGIILHSKTISIIKRNNIQTSW